MIKAYFTFRQAPACIEYYAPALRYDPGPGHFQVYFDDKSASDVDIEEWQWNFGDGTEYNYDQNPNHIYTVPGNYAVSLKITDIDGNTDTYTFGAGNEATNNYPEGQIDVWGVPLDLDPDDGIKICACSDGTNSGTLLQGIDPKVVLYCSNDGGMTFGKPIITTLGKTGQYTKRARFNRLGTSRKRVFKVMISEAVKVQMIGALFDMTVDGS